MTSERYYTVPLAILRHEEQSLAALEAAVSYGITSAGIGYMARHAEDDDVIEKLRDDADEHANKDGRATKPPAKMRLANADGVTLPQSEAEKLWIGAHLGAKLLGITGGRRDADASAYARIHRNGQVFFKIKGDWLWHALKLARHEAGKGEAPERPISWREFRILAAILSGKVNSYGFSFLGWESIQARACGFHSKESFRNYQPALPTHCQPLTRSQIRSTCESLEALGFFARCRYSRGKTGGMMAYSFRHPNRAELIESVKRWDAANRAFRKKVADLRSEDLRAFADLHGAAN